MNTRRLYRSADDHILAGVAGGVAAYFDIDPVIVRIIWFISVFVTGTLTFWVYILMAIVVPVEPADWPAQSPWAPGGAPLGYQANYTPPPSAAGSDPNAPAAGAAPNADGSPDPAATAGQAPWTSGSPQSTAPGGWSGNDWGWQGRQDRWQRRAERWQQRADRRAARDEYRSYGGPGLTFGVLLILAGGLLALNQFVPNFGINMTWPVLVIALGVILVASSLGFRNRD